MDMLQNYFSNYYIESFSNLIYGSVMKAIQMKSFSYLILPIFYQCRTHLHTVYDGLRFHSKPSYVEETRVAMQACW